MSTVYYSRQARLEYYVVRQSVVSTRVLQRVAREWHRRRDAIVIRGPQRSARVRPGGGARDGDGGGTVTQELSVGNLVPGQHLRRREG